MDPWKCKQQTMMIPHGLHSTIHVNSTNIIRGVKEDSDTERKAEHGQVKIVGSTFGGWELEADRHHKRIATLIAIKRKEDYADVVNHIRTRLRFSVLKIILTAVRGVRGKMRQDAPLSTISFNLIEL